MKFYVTWRSSLKAILKNRKRSILTMIGIIIGIASVIAIISLGRGFEKETIKNLTADNGENISVNVSFIPEDSNMYGSNLEMISKRDMQQIAEIEGVKSVDYPKNDTNFVYKEMMIRGKKENKQIEFVKNSQKEPILGRNLTASDNESLNKVAVIDQETAKQLFDQSKNALGRGVEIDGQIFNVVGVYKGIKLASMFSMPESNILVPQKTYRQYFGNDADKDTSNVVVMIEQGYTPNEVTTKVVKKLQDSGTMKDVGDYQVFDMALLTDGIGSILRTLTYFISAIAGISLFIAGVGVMNMMYISVSERTQEIGIRRAMGATAKAIKTQFLLEGVTLTLIGGLIGYILGIIFASIIAKFLDFSVSFDLFTILLAVGVSTGIGLIFSVMPASAAAKKDLIDILR